MPQIEKSGDQEIAASANPWGGAMRIRLEVCLWIEVGDLQEKDDIHYVVLSQEALKNSGSAGGQGFKVIVSFPPQLDFE